MARRDGTEGDDTIRQDGEPGIQVFALGGNDTVILNVVGDAGGENSVDGGEGNDLVVNLFEGQNEILLGDGDDTYVGQGFALGGFIDVVSGGAGNDTIAVTTLHSDYSGDGGNDTFISEGHRNVFRGGVGNDTISYELRDESTVQQGEGVSVDLAQQFANTGNSTVEDLFDIENATGSNFSDQLFGTIAANALRGRGGDDLLVARAGNDLLDGGLGADEMIGGIGNDTYVVDNVDDVVDELNDNGSGVDTVRSTISFSLATSDRLGGVVENLTLQGTADIDGTGNAAANILIGNTGKNILNGGGGADRMTGGAGHDIYFVDNIGDIVDETANGGAGIDTVKSSLSFSLTAGATVIGVFETLTLIGTASINATGNAVANTLIGNVGANILNGAAGADKMFGGAGNDTYVVDNVGDIIDETQNGGAGSDTVKSSISFNLNASTKVVGAFEKLVLIGTDAINGIGNASANTLIGNAAANRLTGGAGNDSLNGGLGMDVLRGEAGADAFVFNTALNAATNRDTIADFSVVDDTIRLDQAIFTNMLSVGTLSTLQFAKNTDGVAVDANDRIIYETDTGKLFFDADGTGAIAAIHFATMTANLNLTNGDFFIF